MKLDHRSLAFVGGAVVLLVVIVALPARRSHPNPSVPASVHPIAAIPDDKSVDVDAPLLLEQRARTQQAEWTRDPFSATPTGIPVRVTELRVPVGASASALPILRGVSICGEDGRAVIGREIVQSGDRLASGYVVGKISARSVTLTRDQEELVLTLGDQP